jgi:hypothetical protein
MSLRYHAKSMLVRLEELIFFTRDGAMRVAVVAGLLFAMIGQVRALDVKRASFQEAVNQFTAFSNDEYMGSKAKQLQNARTLRDKCEKRLKALLDDSQFPAHLRTQAQAVFMELNSGKNILESCSDWATRLNALLTQNWSAPVAEVEFSDVGDATSGEEDSEVGEDSDPDVVNGFETLTVTGAVDDAGRLMGGRVVHFGEAGSGLAHNPQLVRSTVHGDPAVLDRAHGVVHAFRPRPGLSLRDVTDASPHSLQQAQAAPAPVAASMGMGELSCGGGGFFMGDVDHVATGAPVVANHAKWEAIFNELARILREVATGDGSYHADHLLALQRIADQLQDDFEAMLVAIETHSGKRFDCEAPMRENFKKLKAICSSRAIEVPQAELDELIVQLDRLAESLGVGGELGAVRAAMLGRHDDTLPVVVPCVRGDNLVHKARGCTGTTACCSILVVVAVMWAVNQILVLMPRYEL